MAGFMHLWNKWEVQILVLLSFTVQVLLLGLTEWRRRVSSWKWLAALQLILWLLYQLAEYTTTYTLGHMSLSSTSRANQPLMALWAQLLLVHLGGQDTITAYAMEDNQLWLRHLVNLVVQALGAAYVLYRYIAGGGALLLWAGILMFLAGILKYGERIYTLRCSTQDNIVKFLGSIDIVDDSSSNGGRVVGLRVPDAEELLQEAHTMFYLCLGQFVDLKVWPSRSNIAAIKSLSSNTSRLLVELVGMQLSLMRDVLYTKTSSVHTRSYGPIIRVVSALPTFTALSMFPFRSTQGSGGGGDDHEHRVDVGVTYALLVGAALLEVASLFRSLTSTWTCAMMRDANWNRVHSRVISFRKRFKAAERCRKWSGSIGQHDLSYYCSHSLGSWPYGDVRRWIRSKLDYWRSTLYYIDYIEIPGDVESLVLDEIREMVMHCKGQEDTLWSYKGQRSLMDKEKWVGFYDQLYDDSNSGFDRCILIWYTATDVFLFNLFELESSPPTSDETKKLVQAVRVVSKYMMFLLVERPHLLPSPVRRTQYDDFRERYSEVRSRVMKSNSSPSFRAKTDHYMKPDSWHCKIYRDILKGSRHANLIPGAGLARILKEKAQSDLQSLKVIFGVWVEMLCYAASHCNSSAHASQLNSNVEFVTIIWIVTTAIYNDVYGDNDNFKKVASAFFKKHKSDKFDNENNYA